MKNKIIHFFKNLFKIKDKSTRSDLGDMLHALQNNDADKANKAYDQYVINATLNYSAVKAISQGDLNYFLSLHEKVPNDKKSRFLFYKKSFDIAVSQDNEEIFKHILDNNHLTLNDINPDTLLHTLSTKNAYEIASVVLYGLNFTVTEKMKKMLTCDSDGKTHTQMLALIEKRDLYLELGENLKDNQPKEKFKINKI
jgi:predicted RNA-binding protein associated with RNAse of E/G family